MIKTSKINDNVYNFRIMGYSDENFHGPVYKTDKGSSYNAYLVIDEQITLIDTVGNEYSMEFINAIKKVIGDRVIDNIIVNHVEPDHSGGYLDIIDLYPKAKSYCSDKATKPLSNMFFREVPHNVVKTGDSLCTGKYNFTFVQTPFVHWPDNMVTYLNEEKILFSNDAFGSLVTGTKLYDDEYNFDEIKGYYKEYYANIVMPCGKFVLKVIDEIDALDIKINLICPSHGVMIRKNIGELISLYRDWASFKNVKNKVVVVYDTIWGNTEILTNELTSQLADSGLEVHVYKLSNFRPSMIMTEILDASAIVVGSSNFNSTMLPTVADFVERLYALKPKNKVGAVYGSYGWSKAHLARLSKRLEECEITMLDKDVSSNYLPDDKSDAMIETLVCKIKETLEV